MKTLEIPVKFQNGDSVYTTKQTKLEKICSVCDGVGRINYNNKDMRCPECMGAGKFKSDKNIHIVCDEPFIIYITKIKINGENITVKYKGHCGFETLNRVEENLFITKEEAQVRCDELNKEKVLMNINNIVIQDSFKENRPSLSKIRDKIDYYNKHNRFNKNIVIDKDNVLHDGYINYLIYKMLDIKEIKVIVK